MRLIIYREARKTVSFFHVEGTFTQVYRELKIIFQCRPDFEKECIAEVTDFVTKIGVIGYGTVQKGYVDFTITQELDEKEFQGLLNKISIHKLIFTRQLFWTAGVQQNLPENDRVTAPLEELIKSFPMLKEVGFRDIIPEVPDTEEGRELSRFSKSLGNALRTALKKRGIPQEQSGLFVHILLLESQSLALGISHPKSSSSLPMGILRLKFPKQAPSRSTLKLEEAFKVLLSIQERKELLRENLKAVDLGASPGGWTWQFVKRHIHVTAIDNGEMQKDLMNSGYVEHLKVDGYHYFPKKNVHWVVSDMIQKPFPVAELMTKWIASGKAQQAIFNLKLPMKKRYQELMKIFEVIDKKMGEQKVKYTLKAKHLYHDRDEVTVFLRRI